jgi:hypothetical protein
MDKELIYEIVEQVTGSEVAGIKRKQVNTVVPFNGNFSLLPQVAGKIYIIKKFEKDIAAAVTGDTNIIFYDKDGLSAYDLKLSDINSKGSLEGMVTSHTAVGANTATAGSYSFFIDYYEVTTV